MPDTGSTDSVNEVEMFRRQQLRCAVRDAPWDTTLTWADAYGDLPGRDAHEVDQIVIEALMSLLDEGLVYFYGVDDLGEYGREVPEADGLPREVVAETLAGGSAPAPNGMRQVPFLAFRATERGREAFDSQACL